MNVVVVLERFPESAETFVVQEIRALSKHHKVFVLAECSGARGESDITGINVYYAGCAAHAGLFPLQLFLHPVTTIKLALGCLRERINYAETVLRLRALCACLAWQAEVIYCQFGTAGLRFLFLKKLIGLPFAVKFRGHDLTRFVRKQPQGVYGELLNNGDLFLVVCSRFRQLLLSMGCSASKIRVHCSGVNTDEFSPPAGKPYDKTARLLTVARLVEKKGISVVLEALSLLKDELPFQYTIVGDGPLRECLQKMTQEYGLQENVKFAGALPHGFIPQHMRQADIFVLCSLTACDGNQEGIPNAIKEAMACGLPVVATLHSGIPELVNSGTHGYLVPENSPWAVAGTVRRLINDPAMQRRFGRAGRLRILEEFNAAESGRKLNELLEGLCLRHMAGKRAS